MTRKETAERIKIMQAFVDGKQIEFKDCMGYWREANNPSWDWESKREYRIKPESKYRPFANKDECWQEVQKHKPFGCIKAPHGYFYIIGIMDDKVNFGVNNNWLSYDHMFEAYKFIDGSPFGIKD